VVVGLSDAAGLVLDQEHRVQHRSQARVDEHLHGDAAVGEERGGHAGGDRRRVDRGPDLEPVQLHLALGQAEERPRPRIADVGR
jgi:hypothetical protein